MLLPIASELRSSLQQATELALEHAVGEMDRLLQHSQWDQPPLARDLRGVAVPDRMVKAEGQELFDRSFSDELRPFETVSSLKTP